MSGLSFGAPLRKRSVNFDELDRYGFSGFAKRYQPTYAHNFDEMDHTGFSSFAKRSNEFDELDHSGFSAFAKRSTRNNFDELDRAGFTGFAKRGEFDELDRDGFRGFSGYKRASPLAKSMMMMRVAGGDGYKSKSK